ncbi:hypothetical protein GQ457_02G003390 [Hibiscus cannabinus]
MGNADFVYPSTADHRQQCAHRVAIPPVKPFFTSLKNSLKETFFPDDPLRQFKNKTPSKKFILGLQYLFPILEWAPRYSFQFLKSDLISGITIASLAIPQGISYAKLANLPPVLGLYSSFIPALVYAMMGSSRDLAVGTVAVASLLTASMLGKEVNAAERPTLYLHLAFTATFFAGLLQASLGFLRLGFIVDFLSHATIVGFMAGAATVVILQQLKGILGLEHFTKSTDIISVLHSVFSQTHEWRWESGVLGVGFLFFLLVTRYFSKETAQIVLDISDGAFDVGHPRESSRLSDACRETRCSNYRKPEERVESTIFGGFGLYDAVYDHGSKNWHGHWHHCSCRRNSSGEKLCNVQALQY